MFRSRAYSAISHPLVLMYHGVERTSIHNVDAASLEEQLKYLKKQGRFIAPEELGEDGSDAQRRRFLLTFDDGFRNNAELAAPILRRHGIPAVFFVSTRHCAARKPLWFTYLNLFSAHFRGSEVTVHGKCFSMNGRSKKTSLQKLRQCLLDLKPHPSEMYRVIEEQLPPLESFVSPEVLEADGYGMTEEQLRNLASEPLFTIGAHTVDHPLLTRCTAAESRRQIFDGKAWIEQVTGSQCKLFAYPGADYDDSLIELCREAGFRMAFGVNPKPVSLEYLAIPRVGVYGQSLFRLQLKIWYGMRKLGHVLRAGYGLQRPISTN